MLITVEYNYSKCIGAQKCIQIAPNFFSWDGEKAVLNKSTIKDGIQVLSIECNEQQVEQFIKAASSCPINAIKVRNDSGVLVETKIVTDNVKEVVAHYDDEKEFVLDPQGYFLIRIDPVAGNIEVGFCNARNKIVLKVMGKKPIEIYHTIINKLALDIRKDHCAYLGRELQKAYIALQKNIPYVQDDELQIYDKIC
ncbi:ferredoxin [Candidatus Woesearchaeota archaeon]|nr:ferredoxin [Candidatus Woesearchaeota archaeon]